MFSANENLLLRQAKKKVVAMVEATIPEPVLDMGVNVMAMQVTCQAPGCVPIETAIIIVFPHSSNELLSGLPESHGGSYKTKILKPLADVTQQDVYEALPPAFTGGLKTMESLCLQVRDVVFAKISQLFGGGLAPLSSGNDEAASFGTAGLNDDDGDVEGRRLLALYLQESLREYIDRGCVAPEWGQPFPPLTAASPQPSSTTVSSDLQAKTVATTTSTAATAAAVEPLPSTASTTASLSHSKGNIVIRRPKDDDEDMERSTKDSFSSGMGARTSGPSAPMSAPPRPRLRAPRIGTSQSLLPLSSSSAAPSLLSRLAEREHAPGLRQAGCPCCDPDHPSNAADQLLRL